MSVPLDILAVLAPRFPTSERVLSQGAHINENRWRQVADQAGDPETAWCLGNLPRPITRRDIIGLRHSDPAVRRRRVVIASLMWGYGITGTRWGSWAASISDFLRPTRDAVLADCEAHLIEGKTAEAYRLFTRSGPRGTEAENHRGIGFPYITKILYFLARNSLDSTTGGYPLILDTDVSMALAQLTGYRLLMRPADYRPRPDSAAYARYVETMHAWATCLQVLPEVIEYYLWDEAGKPGSPLREACLAQYGQGFL